MLAKKCTKPVLALLVIAIAGCGGSQFPPTVDVSGIVTVDGKPLERVSVTFILQGEAARAGFGETDAEGKFLISTFGKEDGALIGTHTITVSEVPEQSAAAMENVNPTELYNVEGGMFGKPKKLPQRISRKYASPKTSELTATVTEEGPNEFTFVLTK